MRKVYTPRLAGIEEQWGTLPANTPRPRWILGDGGQTGVLWEFVGANDDLRRRITGTVPGTALLVDELPRVVGSLTLTPVRIVPEVMFGWKVHGLVEFGRGRWDPKTLADVALLHRHVRLGRALARAAIEIALRSRGMTPAALDELLGDPTWGRSNSSRKKWRSFRRRAPWAYFEIEEAVEVARSAVGYYLEG